MNAFWKDQGTTNTSVSDQTTLWRAAGCCGLAGGALFFIGDMLMYGHFGSGQEFRAGMVETVRNSPLWRLYLGGLLGPLAAGLCVLGFWHVGRNVAAGVIRSTILFLTSTSMVILGAVHVLWVAKGLAMRAGIETSANGTTLKTTLNEYWNLAYYLGAIPGYLASVILVFMIWKGWSRYPRWTILINPAILFLVTPLSGFVPAPLGSILVGGDANLFLTAFFLASLTTTWAAPNGAQLKPSLS